jgi:hypothetical protein
VPAAARSVPTLNPMVPGTVVGIPAEGEGLGKAYRGIVSDRIDEYGLPLVIRASERTGLVQEEAWLAFTEGHDAKVFSVVAGESPAETLRRARSFIGKPWRKQFATPGKFVAWARVNPAQAGSAAAVAVGVAAVAVIAGAFILLVDALTSDEEEPEDAATGRPGSTRE